MSEELKPCPFCGRAVHLDIADDDYVYCDRCNFSVRGAIWNERAPTDLRWRPVTELPQEGDVIVYQLPGSGEFKLLDWKSIYRCTPDDMCRWLLLRREPPKPDAFEEWYEATILKGKYASNEYPLSKGYARELFQSIEAALKEGK